MTARSWDWRKEVAKARGGDRPDGPASAAAGLKPPNQGGSGKPPAASGEAAEILRFLRAARQEAAGVLEQLRQVLADVQLPAAAPAGSPQLESGDEPNVALAERDAALAACAEKDGVIAELDAKLATAEAEARGAHDAPQLVELQARIARLSEELAEADRQRQESQRALGALEADHSKALRDLTAARVERDAAIAARDAAYTTTAETVGDAIGGSMRLEQEVERLTRALSSAEARLTTAEQERDRARQEARESKRVAAATGESAGPGLQRLVLDVETKLWDFLFMRARRNGVSMQVAAVRILEATQRMAGGKP